jgi:chromosome segregation ATPase
MILAITLIVGIGLGLLLHPEGLGYQQVSAKIRKFKEDCMSQLDDLKTLVSGVADTVTKLTTDVETKIAALKAELQAALDAKTADEAKIAELQAKIDELEAGLDLTAVNEQLTGIQTGLTVLDESVAPPVPPVTEDPTA